MTSVLCQSYDNVVYSVYFAGCTLLPACMQEVRAALKISDKDQMDPFGLHHTTGAHLSPGPINYLLFDQTYIVCLGKT